MYWLDWLIVFLPLLLVMAIACRTQRYVKGVSDFLAAGRVAGRYVVAVAGAEANLGLISVVAMIEMYYNAGFGYSFWSRLTGPLALILALTGYCAYRFRETQAMTMGQFLEMRYSRGFRIYAAILQSISGIINYAIFPAVGARFLIYFLDLPLTVNVFGLAFPTFGIVMAIFLSIAVAIITIGGQVTIMVTDCVQGLLSYPMYLVIVVFVLWKFSWSTEMAPTLLNRPEGESFLNPYNVSKLRDFNVFYVVVGMIGTVINRMSWSGTQGYNAAAASAHEQKMGGLLGTWRAGFSVMMYTLLAIAAYTYLNHANFAPQAAKVQQELAMKTALDVAGAPEFDAARRQIADNIAQAKLLMVQDAVASQAGAQAGINYKEMAGDLIAQVDKGKKQNFNTIYGQMLAPLAIREMLPMGITGIFCAIMIFLLISTDTTYMHSWGSILVQDLILPIRNRPFTPKQQLRLLRIMIAGVAVFAFLFSFFFAQLDYILMFFAITGAIWLGGSGPCIVFGLYWRRGTTAGAVTALTVGSAFSVAGIIIQQSWASCIYPWLQRINAVEVVGDFLATASAPFEPYIMWRMDAHKFPINSQELFFMAMLLSVSLYVVISLLTCKTPFNMDRLLHRGIYSPSGKVVEPIPLSPRVILSKMLGINAQYTLGDKILAWSVFIYSFVYSFLLIFVVVIVWNYFYKWPESWWADYFYITSIVVTGIIGVVSTIWFPICGTIDLLKLFKRLENRVENVLDDGRVVGHISAADLAAVAAAEGHHDAEKEESPLDADRS